MSHSSHTSRGHVDIFNEGMKNAGETAEDLACTKATKHFSAEFKKVTARQKAFDAETDHGKKLGATFGGSSYMGIAYSQKSDVLGWAYDAETKEAASKVALKNCKAKDCKFTVWASARKPLRQRCAWRQGRLWVCAWRRPRRF
jgi:hypothetical protein